MSVHGTRATGRHPETWDMREHLDVGHVRFELSDHPRYGVTFCLRVQADPLVERVPPPLFFGHVEPGMATQLRKLAHRLDELEAKIGRKGGQA